MLVYKKSRSHRWRGQTKSRAFVCIVISAAGYHYQVAPAWFNLACKYRRLIQESPLRAKVADGYDVRPDTETGALRLYDLDSEVSYSIPSQWEQVEKAFLEDPSGRSVSLSQRQEAIDEDCLFSDAKPMVIGRAFIGGELRNECAQS